ncbi:hypothetical protein ACXGQW_03590 [Wenyingzhuangia sp. IMCC45533]
MNSETTKKKRQRAASLNVMKKTNTLLIALNEEFDIWNSSDFKHIARLNNPELSLESDSTFKTFFGGQCKNPVLLAKMEVVYQNLKKKKIGG